MRLVRIEAGRFGKIDGRTLGDLSPSLTVVHGPNEAGKSSLMALVRHVPYGFPTRGDTKEAPYLSDAGAREGRLVFADDDGEWIVERKEGPHGGVVTVRTLSGRARDGLASELTSGVSRLAYRVVFGFGLGEMQQIAELKGKDDDLFARLYAAGAGLAVSPIDVRAKLEQSMDTLWAKRATTATLNRAKARREELRAEIRALECETEGLRSDAVRLEELERQLEAARALRTATRLHAESASHAASEADRLTGEAASASEEASRLAAEAETARRDAAAVAVDEAVLAAGDAVDALVADLSGFRERLNAIANEDGRLAAVEARTRAALGDAGWTEQSALAAAADSGIAGEIEDRREALTRARARVEAAAGARDRMRADGAGAGAGRAGAGSWRVPGAIMAGLGVVAVVVGIVASQLLLAGFGALLTVAGIGLVLAGGRAPSGVGAAAPSRQRPAAADIEYDAAEAALAKITASWGEWVLSRGLGDGSEDPKAISVRYQAARAVHAADAERTVVIAALERERARARGYADSVAAVARPLFGASEEPLALDRVTDLVGRSASRVAEVRAAAAARQDAAARGDELDRGSAEARTRSESAVGAAAAALGTFKPNAVDVAEARALVAEAQDKADAATEEFDRLARDVTELRTRLGSERRENALSSLRLEEETVGEQMAEGVREYSVLAVASKLLALAQERYERDRQPDVVKHAEAAFAGMTNGRYTRLAVPLGADAIEVFDAKSASTSPGRLSRGTAEQLYLALRLGLLEQLGEAGKGLPVLMDDILVDFSPDRLEPAARAIADLSTRRQVVFLTCHPATADLLCRVSPEAVRLELDLPI